MTIEKELQIRSNAQCELCKAKDPLQVYPVPPSKEGAHFTAFICGVCSEQLEHPEKIEVNHWRCLNESMWSEVPAVQALAWRMLNRLHTQDWARDLLDMMYLDEDILEWAKAMGDDINEDKIIHLDSNGAVLQAGDTVVLIKDLKVKGTSFIAKRGTAVRRIRLDPDNPKYIEGKVEGQQIVIITDYVKKS